MNDAFGDCYFVIQLKRKTMAGDNVIVQMTASALSPKIQWEAPPDGDVILNAAHQALIGFELLPIIRDRRQP